jgi:myosin heavy subunit
MITLHHNYHLRTKDGGCMDVDGVDDVQDFKVYLTLSFVALMMSLIETKQEHHSKTNHNTGVILQELCEAFDVLNFEKEVQDSIFHLVAGVLHLGNVEFKESGGKVMVADMGPVKSAAHCLKLPEAVLHLALTSRTLRIR